MVKVTRQSLLCFLENALAFISSVPRLILVKGLGHLLLLSYLIYFACLLLFCCLKPKTPKYLLLSVCSLSLSSVTYQHLLLLVGFDTLIYRKAKIDPLDLYQESFIGAVNGRGDPTKPINFSAINELLWHRCRGV